MTIPQITSPLGDYWKQPNPCNILIDENYAVMSEDTYKQLSVYNSSYPSGSYVGKMWRRFNELVWIDKDTTGQSESGLQYFYREILIV